MADKSKTIIIKRVKKHHAEAHGGSWKVAYADFVTAMMAFFLLLWLISMVTPEKRAIVADYFKNYNLFSQSGRSFMEYSSGIKQELKTSTEEPATGAISMHEVQKKLKISLDEMQGLQSQVLVDQLDEGLRIQIVDLEGKPMFQSGSAVPTERCKQILRVVTECIKDARILVAVEGHTDAAGSKTAREKNWDLSTARATFARKMIEGYGLDQEKISKVVGYADTDLLDKEDPTSARNRRISLILTDAREKKTTVATPKKEEEPKPISIIPPSVTPEPPAVKPAETKPLPPKAPEKEDGKKKLVDPGIAPKKPIDIRPTLFPNINQ
jgi:chemotaxis protein MotB